MIIVGLQPTVIASRAPHLLLEQIVGLQPTVIASRASPPLLEPPLLEPPLLEPPLLEPVNEQSVDSKIAWMCCRLTTVTYRHRFARAAPAPDRAKRYESWTCASPVKWMCIARQPRTLVWLARRCARPGAWRDATHTHTALCERRASEPRAKGFTGLAS